MYQRSEYNIYYKQMWSFMIPSRILIKYFRRNDSMLSQNIAHKSQQPRWWQTLIYVSLELKELVKVCNCSFINALLDSDTCRFN